MKQKPRIVIDERTKQKLDGFKPSDKFTYDEIINMVIDLIPPRVKLTISETKKELEENQGVLFTKMIINKLKK